MDYSNDNEFERLARLLAPSNVKRKKPKRERLDFDEGEFESLRSEFEVDEEEEDDEDAVYLRDFVGRPGPGLAVDYEERFFVPFYDKGDGEVDITPRIGQEGTFTRATIATTVDRNGQVVQVAAGVPRSYYDPATGEYLGYLAEGARTNLVLSSESFGGASWTKQGATTTDNSTAAPDGALTADKVVEDTSESTVHRVSQTASATLNAALTVSIWVKAAERTQVQLLVFNNAATANFFHASYNLLTLGTISSGGGGTGSLTETSIESYPGDWYRIKVTGIVDSGVGAGTALWQIRLVNGGSNTYTGDGTSGLYLWGAQLEAGSFASSYIPTTSAAVARNMDVLTYPGAGLYSLAGTAYAELKIVPSQSGIISPMAVVLGGLSGRAIWNGASNPTHISIYDGTTSASKTGLTSMETGVRKRATSWGPLGMRAAGDGVAPGEFAFDGTFGESGVIGVGCQPAGGNTWQGTLKNVRLFKKQMPDAALQALTA